jgi:uncharacterized delta-60 repeat protein
MWKRAAVLLIVSLSSVAAAGFEAKAEADAGPASHAGASSPAVILDKTFGVRGLLRVPNEGTEGAHAAALEDGDLLLRERSGFRLLSSSGGTGTAFGGAGTLTPPPGKDEFRLEDFTLDPLGRLLLVGTAFPSAEETAVEGMNGTQVNFAAADAEILRLLPDGRLDPTFGDGGVVETDFGLPPAQDGEGRPFIASASVGAGGVAVDPRGGIVVTGSAAIGVGPSCVHDIFESVGVSAPFVARLTENGSIDPAFSGDGVVGGRTLSEIPLGSVSLAPPVVSPDGTVTYRSTAIWPCGGRYGLAQLTAAGRTRNNLGRKGTVGGYFRALASDSDDSVVAVARMGWTPGERFKARVVRITPGGEIDRSFGEDGRAVVKLGPVPGNEPDSLALDARGRILLGGTLATARGRSILLARLSAAGRLDRAFGPDGWIATPVHGLISQGPGDLFIDPEGRLGTVHRYATPKGSGLVLARFLLRSRFLSAR